MAQELLRLHEFWSEGAVEPVTKADLRRVESSLRTEIEGVDQRLITIEKDVTTLKSDVASLKETTASILNVVQSIDERLKEWQDLPERVSKLEEDVTQLMLRR